jgi:multiple sugar transport system substrate-binding protein
MSLGKDGAKHFGLFAQGAASMSRTTLRGITWNHSRALPPLVATAQRFEELHPGVQIEWRKRSLHEFGHTDLGTLAQEFDLLVIDHPMAGDAESDGVLTDLLPLLLPGEVQDLEEDSIGPSYASYLYHGRLYALPIDAAAPAASLRPDLLERHRLVEPKSWDDVVAMARMGWVRMPGFSADMFLNFMGLYVSLGYPVANNPDHLVDHEVGAQCLEQICELAALMPDEIYSMNPIALYERMAREDTIAYCPFAYTYSNYSRRGFGERPVRFADPVKLSDGRPIRTVLGGTGLAISAKCANRALALEYSLFVSGRTCQQTLYGVCGGQPARRSAWQDERLNALTDDFFRRTAKSLETAYVRPRYRGYVSLQESGGGLIAEFCRQHADPRRTLDRLDSLYRATLKGDTPDD